VKIIAATARLATGTAGIATAPAASPSDSAWPGDCQPLADLSSMVDYMIRLGRFLHPAVRGLIAALAIIPFASSSVAWQKPAASPAFEVASVKFAGTSGASGVRIEPGRLLWPRATLRAMIELAYQIQPYQVLGGPAWLSVDRYSINAKADSPADRNQLLIMLRGLITERFKLTFHHEMREMSAYALVVGKNGTKFRNSKDRPPHSLSFNGIASVVRVLSEASRSLVVDETKLVGPFDIMVDLSRYQEEPQNGASSQQQYDDFVVEEIQRQTGLKLEPRKERIDVLVIDRAAKMDPGAN